MNEATKLKIRRTNLLKHHTVERVAEILGETVEDTLVFSGLYERHEAPQTKTTQRVMTLEELKAHKFDVIKIGA